MNPRLPDKPEEYLTTRGLADYIADRRLSQSFLARLNVCPYSAKLYAEHRQTRVQTHAMARGEIAHEGFEWHTRTCVEEGVERIDSDVMRETMEHLCEQRTDLVVPEFERDVLRAIGWNYAEATRVDLENPPVTEVDFVFEVGGWTVTGRRDWLAVYDREAYVKDYKTPLSMPSQEKFDNRYQGKLYALGTLEKNPRLERVHYCEEYPRMLSKRCVSCGTYNLGHLTECKECADLRFDPPSLGRRRITFEKRDLHDFKRALISQLANLDSYLASGDWPASPGSHCNTCPAQRECPLPASHLPLEVTGPDHAVEVAQNLHVLDDIRDDVREALKAYVDEVDTAVAYGDKEWDFKPILVKKGEDDFSVSWRFDCRTRDQTQEPAPSQRFQKEAA